MKKISLYIMALLTMGLVACNEDFAPTSVPQSNPQENLIEVSDITVSPIATSISIPELIAAGTPIDIAKATVKEGAMPANTVLKAEVEVSNTADFAKSVVLDANVDENNVISIQPSELQDAYFAVSPMLCSVPTLTELRTTPTRRTCLYVLFSILLPMAMPRPSSVSLATTISMPTA